jgi:hypothetical protein
VLTFKDLKRRVSLEATVEQQFKLFERLLNKPFWIWDQQQHKLEDIKTNGECCFNHIIGLPRKDGVDKPYTSTYVIKCYLNSSSSALDIAKILPQVFKERAPIMTSLALLEFSSI